MINLLKKANRVTESFFGNSVFFRGLIEFSNVCEKNCLYCGLRKDNNSIVRYTMTEEEILEVVRWAHAEGYRTIVLQSGEVSSPKRVDFICRVVEKIKKMEGIVVSLCVGELSMEDYKRLFNAGATRFLLRIETSNPDLYKKIHPQDHSFTKRLECLSYLKEIGYQTGTGIMIGLPGQTQEDLINDMLFFKKMDIDMVGMGPYIPHSKTPLQDYPVHLTRKELLDLSLWMIASTRILLKDVNIVATTALQAIDPNGREKALLAGANVLMPILTPKKYRNQYLLYENKPCVEEEGKECTNCLRRRLTKIGKRLDLKLVGDSPHFLR